MAGTVSKPIFWKDGAVMSFTADATITLGNVVCITTADHVDVCGAASALAIGVAVGGNRFSRTQTDNTVASGSLVTVQTRGIVYVYTDASAITVGAYVKPGAAGIVIVDGAPAIHTSLGMALDANGSAATTIRVKLMKG